MKSCTTCQRSYEDDMSFCVYDGQVLIEAEEIDPYIDRILDNKYSIDYKIDEGGTGKVYRATHRQLQLVVAVKIMHRALTNDPVAVERFRREAYAAMKVRHPNAVAVLDFGITEDRLVYVVMELLIGQSLYERLKVRKYLLPVEANTLMQQICAAVSVAHARGIVHRDLKPENIFLHQEDGQEIVKVLDFGIAKLQEFSLTDEKADTSGNGAIVGTPFYIAPEQCSGQNVDGRADIYSLGIVLYQLLTGQLPFDGPSSIIVLLKQLNEKPLPIMEVRPELPKLLNGVVMHALEKDPRSRPQSIISFAKELVAAIRAISELEFQDVFLHATEKELEAAILFTGDGGNRRGTGELPRTNLMSIVQEDISNKASEPSAVPASSNTAIVNSLAETIQGDLSWFDLASIMHMSISLKLTGLLTLHNVEAVLDQPVDKIKPFALVYLEKGDITHVKLGVRQGPEAFYQLFQMPLDGCFFFKATTLPMELETIARITLTGPALLKEALGLKTLLSRFALKFPDLLTSFKRRGEQMNWRDKDTEELAQTIWRLLAHANITIGELLARSPCCNAKTYQVLATLLATRQISSVKTSALTKIRGTSTII